jgi:hypothetical protein
MSRCAPPINNNMCTPQVFYQHLFAIHHPHTQPHYTQPHYTHTVACALHPTPTLILNPPCHSPNPSPFSSPPPSMTVHGPTWCRGRLRSTGLRAVFAEWDDFGFLFGVCDDALWALLNTPAGGVMLEDQSSLPLLPWEPTPTLLPVTSLNAPRTPGRPASHARHLSVLRSSKA